MSKFQLILLGVFGFFIVAAVMVFALYRGSGSEQFKVVVWGSLPAEDFRAFLNAQSLADQNFPIDITYVEKPVATLERDFTEALAQGDGPDLVVLRQDQFYKNKAKLIPIPYESLSERDFKETFIEAGELYLMPEGIYGLPLIADPMILYYNRDLLSNGGVANPLRFWDEIYAETGNLTKRDAAGNLVESTVALGEAKNINNMKDILSLLLLQAGTPITTLGAGELQSSLGSGMGLPVRPAESALEFYTQFSNPTKSFYSWNRVLPEAQTRFTSGDLAYYLGFASELRALRSKNPTLNFAVSPVPQSRVSGRSMTVARLYSLSVSRGTSNMPAALLAATKMISPPSAEKLSRLSLLPPARRDLLSTKPTDSVMPVFYNSALQSRSWIDPNAAETNKIFTEMVEAVTSGRARVSEAVGQAESSLENLI